MLVVRDWEFNILKEEKLVSWSLPRITSPDSLELNKSDSTDSIKGFYNGLIGRSAVDSIDNSNLNVRCTYLQLSLLILNHRKQKTQKLFNEKALLLINNCLSTEWFIMQVEKQKIIWKGTFKEIITWHFFESTQKRWIIKWLKHLKK